VTLLALLPSPLLGPRSWAEVAARLRDAGHEVVVPAPAGEDPAAVLRSFADALPEGDVVLVPHSNAGLYAAALAARRPVTACVFVDAALPAPAGATPTAPASLVGHLEGLADDAGRLPPWTDWWSPIDLAGLFPSDEVRAAVAAEQPRLPLSYVRASVPAPSWDDLPAAFLAFGTTYAAEAARAERLGWPVARLEGRHLHQLVDPDAVAAAVLDLVARLATKGATCGVQVDPK
jgi:pimeloyl-ACP methyl ester carboxylesterase